MATQRETATFRRGDVVYWKGHEGRVTKLYVKNVWVRFANGADILFSIRGDDVWRAVGYPAGDLPLVDAAGEAYWYL